MDNHQNHLDRLEDLISKAKAAGADAVDAILISSTSLPVSRRLGNPEHLERSESSDIGLRVFVGKKQAIVSSSDLSENALAALPDRAVAMARVVPEDPFCGLAPSDILAADTPDLDMCDPLEPSAETLIEWASEAEDAALGVKGVSNSEGGHAGWSLATVGLAASNGMAHAYRRSQFSISASVVAGEGTAMERDYDYSAAVHAADLASPGDIGLLAGEKAVRRLNPRQVETTQVPVVYDPRVARTIPGHLASAINGTAVARGTTFLRDKLGASVFPNSVSIIDDQIGRASCRERV